jgi:hypothetical protein
MIRIKVDSHPHKIEDRTDRTSSKANIQIRIDKNLIIKMTITHNMHQIITNITTKEIVKKTITNNIQNTHIKMNIMKKVGIITTMISITREDRIKMNIIITINNFLISRSLKMTIEIKIFINSKDGMDQTFFLPRPKGNCKSRQKLFKKKVDNFQ